MKATFILQKEVLEDLYLREEEFESFIKFIKKNFRDYNLVTDFIDIEETIKCVKENPIFEFLMDKMDQIHYLKNMEQIINDGSITKYCSKRTIVLCTFKDELCHLYHEKLGILFFNLQNLNQWNFFNEVIYCKSLKVTKDKNYPTDIKFVQFSDITQYLKYCTSIIIFDKYLFCNKSNQKIEKNLYSLLLSIFACNNNKNIELTIISEFKDDEIKKQYENIVKLLTAHKINRYKLNLIHHDKAFYPRGFEGLHSRFILSNYVHIISNDSFNYFKDNNNINNLVDIDIKFNLTWKNSRSYLKDLQAVKTYVNKTTNEPLSSKNNLKITSYKCKENSLLRD